VTTNHAAGLTADLSLDQIERLDEEIIALLARRRAMAQELPAPARARVADPAFAERVRGITGRYRKELGGAGELVARAVIVLCDPSRES
jgi:chorismate mutase